MLKKAVVALQRRALLSVHCNSSIRLDSPAAGASAVPALKYMLVAQFFPCHAMPWSWAFDGST